MSITLPLLVEGFLVLAFSSLHLSFTVSLLKRAKVIWLLATIARITFSFPEAVEHCLSLFHARLHAMNELWSTRWWRVMLRAKMWRYTWRYRLSLSIMKHRWWLTRRWVWSR